MNKKEYKKNVEYLQENGCNYLGFAWDDKETSAEIESFTNAGGDMIIVLEHLCKSHLQQYIDDFDINEEVVMWWRDGKRDDVPFSNIKEHYEDLEAWLIKLQAICYKMPY